jgi:NAD kinase
VPIIGINTDPQRSVGFLCGEKVFHKQRKENIKALFDKVNKGQFKYTYRSRLLFDYTKGARTFKEPILNELFFSNSNTSSMSKYQLKVDGKTDNIFQSSGLICSTGTGSSSWLYSCKRLSSDQVKSML